MTNLQTKFFKQQQNIKPQILNKLKNANSDKTKKYKSDNSTSKEKNSTVFK